MAGRATHSRRAVNALRALTEADPALAALALWCQHRDAETLDAPAETEGTTIRYGPAFATLLLHEQVGLAGHHVLHVALQHSARMADMALRLGEGFQPDLWQIACDAIVNEAILAAGHALPRPVITLTSLLGGPRQGADSPGAALADWDCGRLYHRLAQSPEGAAHARRHARDQAHRHDLQPEGGKKGATHREKDGSDRGSNGGSDSTGQDRGAWRAHLARALAVGRAAGFGLGVLGGPLADLPQPRTPWEIVLRRLIARATLPRPQPSAFRPARAWLAQGARALQAGRPLPPWQPRQRHDSRQPRLVVALDCSGSIPPDMLRLLMAEVAGIARRSLGSVHLLVFDEAVRIDQPLDPLNWPATLRTLDLPQGGGTDFAPVLTRAAALDPSALVVLSDMDGPFGTARPRFPVIWATPQATAATPPFGQVLSLAH
ncbi:MAG: vWA domain-containing protein [Pararhodobacter sp.]